MPEPLGDQILVRVKACGVCRTDLHVVEGELKPRKSPLIPGHQVVGVIQKMGPEARRFPVGARVGIAWLHQTDGVCEYCRAGKENLCEQATFTGYTVDGGYAEYAVAPEAFVYPIPESFSDLDAAPLLCAGITTFNALRNSGARPGDVVAVLGIGGLGHLGIQYAAKSGFRTVAIARGKDKEPLARKLGASVYIDSQKQDPAAELRKLGGANVILSTVTVGDAMSAVQSGLAAKGTLIVIGAAESVELSPLILLNGCRSVKGWYSGTAMDSQDTLAFSARTGVRSMNEVFPLERVNEAYERMMSGKARFRVVLTMK
jgi:D-arabinose 1-dehydrogenase-like Zn-dependent alcohol dehydrogenase